MKSKTDVTLAAEEASDDHSGNRFVLIKAGKNEWRYYGLTLTQLRIWRRLTKSEQGSLVHAQERQCLICALKAITETRKEIADQLYSSMMASLLVKGKRA